MDTKFIEVQDVYYDVAVSTDELKRYAGGPILRKLLDSIEAQDSGKSKVKINLLGGHNENVAHTLRVLGAYGASYYPDFGSALIFEKYRDSNNKKLIRVRILIL